MLMPPLGRISSLLIKPASALCNLDCSYCFYLDRELDPYKEIAQKRMSQDTLRRLVESYLFYSHPQSTFAFQGGEPTLAGLPFFGNSSSGGSMPNSANKPTRHPGHHRHQK